MKKHIVISLENILMLTNLGAQWGVLLSDKTGTHIHGFLKKWLGDADFSKLCSQFSINNLDVTRVATDEQIMDNNSLEKICTALINFLEAKWDVISRPLDDPKAIPKTHVGSLKLNFAYITKMKLEMENESEEEKRHYEIVEHKD